MVLGFHPFHWMHTHLDRAIHCPGNSMHRLNPMKHRNANFDEAADLNMYNTSATGSGTGSGSGSGYGSGSGSGSGSGNLGGAGGRRSGDLNEDARERREERREERRANMALILSSWVEEVNSADGNCVG
ncbi:MAG: hypothetical protein Q9159_003642 [Coniocarpon cinnabarinum]